MLWQSIFTTFENDFGVADKKVLVLFIFKLLVSTDLSCYADLATWIFQRKSAKLNTEPLFAVAFSGSDKLQVLPFWKLLLIFPLFHTASESES